MNSKLHTILICSSIFLFFVALYFFPFLFVRADTSAEKYIKNVNLGTGLFLFTLSVGLGVWAIFLEVPHDPSIKFQSKRFGCLMMALLIVGSVAIPILIRMLTTIH